MIQLEISELSNAFDLIIRKLRFENIELIKFEDNLDYYNIIPTDQWDYRNDPKAVSVLVESLHDDVECIKKLSEDPNRPCTYVDFDRVSSILRAISEMQNPA